MWQCGPFLVTVPALGQQKHKDPTVGPSATVVRTRLLEVFLPALRSLLALQEKPHTPWPPTCPRLALGRALPALTGGKRSCACLSFRKSHPGRAGLCQNGWGHWDPGCAQPPGCTEKASLAKAALLDVWGPGGHLPLSGHPTIPRAFTFTAHSQSMRLKIQLIPEQHGGWASRPPPPPSEIHI